MTTEEKNDAKNSAKKQKCDPNCCSGEQIAEMMAKCCKSASDDCATKMQEMMKGLCAASPCCDTPQ